MDKDYELGRYFTLYVGSFFENMKQLTLFDVSPADDYDYLYIDIEFGVRPAMWVIYK